MSPSTRGAWIETSYCDCWFVCCGCRPPLGGRGLKHKLVLLLLMLLWSPSTRGAWIETVLFCFGLVLLFVALHSGGVD